LFNKGPIDAPFTIIPPNAPVSCCFKFTPNQGMLAPGESQTIQISFHATLLGSLYEEFQFSAGSPGPAILIIKGFVEGSSLHFNIKEIDFGDVSFGIPCTRSCRLTNTSSMSLRFKLRIPDDGSGPTVSAYDQIRDNTDPSWRNGIQFHAEPKEFTMTPSQGTILPQAYQDIEVTLCSNTVMEYYRYILVDVEGVGEGVVALTVMGRCHVPKLTPFPFILWYDECRLKEPHERKFLIKNSTPYIGCYGLLPQKRKADTPVFYSSPKPCGLVQPFSVAEIPVIIEVQAVGDHSTNVV
ncbi:HYDIN protein, partial [Edolisoma coerulescens]|nr:HYDIN protein [Edolisoma coerulescens]